MKLTENQEEIKQEAIRNRYQKRTTDIGMRKDNLQYVFTPYKLCEEMILKLKENTGLKKKNILVFNLEFAIVLMEQGVLPENITFLTDCIEKVAFAKFLGVAVMQEDFKKIIDEKRDLGKFDVVIGNPPYNMGTSGGNGKRDLWPDFVYLAINNLVNEKGYLVFVNPSRWRQPEEDLFLLFRKNNLIYLEIHDDNDGKKTFGATTRYDWYVLQKINYQGSTEIRDELGEINHIDVSNMSFLPNYHFQLMQDIIIGPNDKQSEILFSYSAYEAPRKNWMSEIQDDKYKYPCIYSRYQDGSTNFYYSSEDKGMFGTSKVIINVARYPYPLLDVDGKYGMCQNTFGIKIDNEKEGQKIIDAINTEKFKELLIATRWSNFQINWKMFKYFKKDFWKEFLDDIEEE